MRDIFDKLNPMQKEAVTTVEGPALVLAGAGSGKTRALTHRIAYLMEEGVDPWNILAITFTNKAAEEMRKRVDAMVPAGAESIWISTFHALCVRILRRHIHWLGYENDFTVYDSDDQRTLMRQVIKKLDKDPKQYRERAMLAFVSSLKDKLIGPEEYASRAAGDYRLRQQAEIYAEYQASLKKNNAVDFDDLIMLTVELFRTQPEVLTNYQNRFRYIMVDEYQDTNAAQFELVSILAGRDKNLWVVGDDDQSIYKFRGADIQNILNFENVFPGAKVIRLEQNYRSTGSILNCANEVIANNASRKGKTLWTSNGKGDPVELHVFSTAMDEAGFIMTRIKKYVEEGGSYKDVAVLFRTNAQTRILEETAERIIGHHYRTLGLNFYDRREVKDIIAYLRTIANARDDLAVTRIINVPKRGIGATSLGKVADYGAANGLSLFEACTRAEQIQGLGRTAGKIRGFVDTIRDLRSLLAEDGSIPDLIDAILSDAGYQDYLMEEDDVEAETRLEYIGSLKDRAAAYEEDSENPTLNEFLEDLPLQSDQDRMQDDEDKVLLMTLHSAKGLEFPVVFLAGMEEGLFPSSMAINSDDPASAIEEERRLCYVGMTRAEKQLFLTAARSRMTNGETRCNPLSRFINEIPPMELKTVRADGGNDGSSFGRRRDSEYDLFGSDDDEIGSFRKRRGFDDDNGSTPSIGSRFRSRYGDSEGYGMSRRSYDRDDGSRPPVIGGFSRPEKKPADLSGLTKGSDFITPGENPGYAVGDRVHHKKFGDGTVLSIEKKPRDYEVAVMFDEVGRKVLLAAFAKMTKIGE